ESVGSGVRERPVCADERLPRALVARRAQPCELDIAIRGASPLGRPCTLSRAPLRRRALFAWLTRVARSRLHVLAATSSLPQPFAPGRFRTDRSVHSHLHPPSGFAPRTPLHALSLAASPARSAPPARRSAASLRSGASLGCNPDRHSHRRGHKAGPEPPAAPPPIFLRMRAMFQPVSAASCSASGAWRSTSDRR